MSNAEERRESAARVLEGLPAASDPVRYLAAAFEAREYGPERELAYQQRLNAEWHRAHRTNHETILRLEEIIYRVRTLAEDWEANGLDAAPYAYALRRALDGESLK